MITRLLVNKFGVTLSLMIKLATLKTNFPDLIHLRFPSLSIKGHNISHHHISSKFSRCNLLNASVKGYWTTTIWTNRCKTKNLIKISLSPKILALIFTNNSRISITRRLPRTQHKINFSHTSWTTRTNNKLFNRKKRRRRPTTIDTVNKWSKRVWTNSGKTRWWYFINLARLTLLEISIYWRIIQGWPLKIWKQCLLKIKTIKGTISLRKCRHLFNTSNNSSH